MDSYKSGLSITSKQLLLIVLAFCVVSCEDQTSGAARKVKLSLFFESKCPDSRRFIVDQLIPTYQTLNGSMELDFVPFGKARTLGQNRMICQHGPSECQGNRFMACILARSSNQTANLLAIGCLFDWNKTEKDCTTEHLGKAVDYEDLQRCSKSEESYTMMQDYEKRTGRISYVPRIEINGKQTGDFEADCEHDLIKCIREVQRS